MVVHKIKQIAGLNSKNSTKSQSICKYSVTWDQKNLQYLVEKDFFFVIFNQAVGGGLDHVAVSCYCILCCSLQNQDQAQHNVGKDNYSD